MVPKENFVTLSVCLRSANEKIFPHEESIRDNGWAFLWGYLGIVGVAL